MLDTMLRLANRGVDVLRLDAAPFMWKRLGTDCQNQPEVHTSCVAYRALVAIAAPASAFKAEAIVAPDHLVAYLGAHERERPECDLAYHNQLMVHALEHRWPPGTPGSRPVRWPGCARSPSTPSGSPTCAATTTSAGPCPTRTPAPSASTPPRTASSSATSTPAVRRLVRPRRGVPAQPGTGDGASPARPPRWPARRGAGPGDDGRARPRPPPAAAALLGRLRLRRRRRCLHGRRARAAQRPHLGGRSRAPDDNRWMHRPPMDWAAAARRHDPAPSRRGVRRHPAARRRRGPSCRRSTVAAGPRSSAPADEVLCVRRKHRRRCPSGCWRTAPPAR